MASPQKEDGYLQIANEFWEAMARFEIPGRQYRVLSIIIRKTWGWGKKTDRISISQISAMTGIESSHVCHVLKWLKEAKMITRDKNGLTGILKDYEKWAVPSKAVPSKAVPSKAINIAAKGNQAVPYKAHTKEIGKRQERQGSALAKKPFIEGDRAWQDPANPNHWRVQIHSGQWVDYSGNVKKNLVWK